MLEGEALPVETVLPQLIATLKASNTAVLVAPPGAGKSTRVPLALAAEPWLNGRRILLLQPRRLAAVAIATYLAELRGEKVGASVGYTVRFERRVSSATRIEVVTEGILTRRLQADPELTGVGLVIFDEFHERSLQADLGLALVRDAQQALSPDLRLLLMSATLDGAEIASQLNHAPLIQATGRSYPVRLNYLPAVVSQALPIQISAALQEPLRQNSGDILVFLPGVGEIRACQRKLTSDPRLTDLEVLPLHGSLPVAEQRRLVRPGDRRRIILATNVAETSLTIESISTVIDSGLERRARYAPESGMTRLETCRISRASAEQRAGRAGRLGPGSCYRLWTESEQHGLIDAAPPEIRQTDLAGLALELVGWGVADGGGLCWLDPPPARALAAAQQLLVSLGAITTDQQLTETGRELTQWPLHPRLGRLLQEARRQNCLPLGCDLVALLDGRTPLPSGSAGRDSESDLLPLLEELWRKPVSAGYQTARRLATYWRQYFRVASRPANPEVADISCLLAAAFPDRIGKQRPGRPGDYLLSGGQGVSLGRESGLGRTEGLVAVELLAREGTAGRICRASRFDLERLPVLFPDQVRWQRQVRWDRQLQRVNSLEQLYFSSLVLRQRSVAATADERVVALCEGIRSLGADCLDWSAASRQLLARLRLARRLQPEDDWPDLSDAWLQQHLEQWLGPFLQRLSSRADLERLDPLPALQALLDYRRQQRLERLLPTQLQLPSGARQRLDYTSPEPPIMAIKLQELFGQQQTPSVAGGRLPVTLHLLSPARRPIQVTRDLAGFWQNTYAEVRRELAGRYPKHSWPKDPCKESS